MNMISNFTLNLDEKPRNIIKVIGVGGGGGNAANHMHQAGIKDVDFVVCNTDAQALNNSAIPLKIQLGPSLTGGRGAGAKPDVGKNAAIENIEEVKNLIGHETRMVFITAGMGGGTGTGAAPVIADACREMGILTVAIVTIPFSWEGPRRRDQAINGIEALKDKVDAMLVIANDKVREFYGNLSIREAFSKADDVLLTAAKGIAEIITVQGYVNVDFSDIETVLTNSGVAVMGTGQASGQERAREAVETALNCPLLNNSDIQGARWILLNVTSGNQEITMEEIETITDFIQLQAGTEADIIWGNCFDESLNDDIRVTVIATQGDQSKLKINYEQKTIKKNASQPLLPKTELELVNKTTVQIETEKASEPNLQQNTQPSDAAKNEDKIKHDLFKETSLNASRNEFSKQSEEESQQIEWNTKTVLKTETETNTYIPTETNTFASRIVESRSRLEALQSLNTLKRGTIQPPNNMQEVEALESTPAYLRKGTILNNTPHSSETNSSRYSLSESRLDSARPNIKPGNSYLHDQVD